MPFKAHFLALTESLRFLESFWRESSFYCFNMQWREDFPKLNDALFFMDDATFRNMDQSPEVLALFLSQHIPGYDNVIRLTEVAALNHRVTINPRLQVDVPGRKWSQIESFIGALPVVPSTKNKTVVDWCSGKSYLGRAVANYWGSKLHAVECQQALCESGRALASPWVESVQFSQKDVLKDHHDFLPSDFVVALHACGDLHRSLLRQWRQSNAAHLVLAPCCYHQWFKGNYVPLSEIAQKNDLVLTRNQVRLAVQEMVTSSSRVRSQVALLGQWRMAFDLVQRDIRGVDEYLSTVSLPFSSVKKGAEFVIRTLAECKSITIPPDFDFQPYLIRAEQRYAEFQRLQLVAHGFRRALELWLVLDLVLFLEEGGCEVELASFCPRDITPRNLRICATRKAM